MPRGTLALRATVLPLRTVPGATVSVRTTVLPAAARPRTTAALGTVSLRGTVTLRAGVLPRRPLRTRSAARGAPLLPRGLVVAGRRVLVSVPPRPLVAVSLDARGGVCSRPLGPARSTASAPEAGGLTRTASGLGTAVSARSVGTAAWTCHDFWSTSSMWRRTGASRRRLGPDRRRRGSEHVALTPVW